MPIQHGCPITSQTMCSASEGGVSACSFLFRHIGHFVMSSGQTYGATLAGASQNLIRNICFRFSEDGMKKSRNFAVCALTLDQDHTQARMNESLGIGATSHGVNDVPTRIGSPKDFYSHPLSSEISQYQIQD